MGVVVPNISNAAQARAAVDEGHAGGLFGAEAGETGESLVADRAEPVLPVLLGGGDQLDHALAGEAQFAPARITSGRAGAEDELKPEVRIAATWRDLGPLRPMLEQRLMAALPDIRARIGGGGPMPTSLELELAAHGDGAHFKPHTDTALGSDRKALGAAPGEDRLISGVYYFHAEPKGFSGGELRLYRFGVDPGAGELDRETQRFIGLLHIKDLITAPGRLRDIGSIRQYLRPLPHVRDDQQLEAAGIPVGRRLGTAMRKVVAS